MHYDSEITAQIAWSLNSGGLGRPLCEKILPCAPEDLALAVLDGDMKSLLELLMARRPGSAGYPELECSAERLRYLCLAITEEMRREAMELAGSIPHPLMARIRAHLMNRDSGAARAVLYVASGKFRYSHPLRKLEDGWTPEPGYLAIEDAVPEDRKDALRRLAYIATRMPTG